MSNGCRCGNTSLLLSERRGGEVLKENICLKYVTSPYQDQVSQMEAFVWMPGSMFELVAEYCSKAAYVSTTRLEIKYFSFEL